MRVQIIAAGSEHLGVQPGVTSFADAPGWPASYGPWRPRSVLGATSAGGLLLPEAKATPAWLYAPRAVCIGAGRVIVADTGNHRVLLFNSLPESDGQPADLVLGQRDFFGDGPNASGAGPVEGMHLPTGVLVTDDGRLVVADAWNHRVLVWDHVPSLACAPDVVLGQPSAAETEPNRGGEPSARSFYWPFGIAVVDGRFYVADTGNRRVLCWLDGVPADADRPADVVLGQDGFATREENRGDVAAADSFRWPHAVTGNARGGVLVADAGNHRVLGWGSHPEADRPADYVLGQPDMTTAVEFPYRPQTGTCFRFPYAAAVIGAGLAVADTANNRVLLWDAAPTGPDTPPDHVLAQPSFASNGENRWQSVARDTLCWPYGLGTNGHVLAVADSGNNRVVLWERT